MPDYSYTAVADNGSILKEIISSESKIRALQFLQNKNYQIISIEEKRKSILTQDLFENWTKIKITVFLNFAKQLSFLLKSGIPIFQAFSIVADQINDSRLKKALAGVKQHMLEGLLLSLALQKYKHLFSDIFINMVRVGEKDGNLPQALDNAIDYMEKEHTVTEKLKSAMTYPLIMLFAGIGIMIVMFSFVFPRFVEIFQETDVQLPVATQLLIKLSNIGANSVGQIIFLIAFLIIGGFIFLRWPKGRLLFDQYKFKIPVIGNLMQNFALVRISRTLGTMLDSGVHLVEALQVTRDVSRNKAIERDFDSIIKEIREGQRLAVALERNCTVIPTFMIETITTGERAGVLPAILLDLARHFNSKVEEDSKRLTDMMEPIIMVFMGIFVMFIAMAIILPMFSMASGAGNSNGY